MRLNLIARLCLAIPDLCNVNYSPSRLRLDNKIIAGIDICEAEPRFMPWFLLQNPILPGSAW